MSLVGAAAVVSLGERRSLSVLVEVKDSECWEGETGSGSFTFQKTLPQCIWFQDHSHLCLPMDLGIDGALMSLEDHLRSFSDH